MLFKKTKTNSPIENLAESLKAFIHFSTKNAVERLSKEILDLPNFNLTFEYESFSIFIVDYCVTSKFKDPKLRDLILDSFYSKLNTYYSDEQFRILKFKLEQYAHVVKENKKLPTIIENFGLIFSKNVLNSVDLDLVSRFSEEYAALKSELEKLIDESKLNEINKLQ